METIKSKLSTMQLNASGSGELLGGLKKATTGAVVGLLVGGALAYYKGYSVVGFALMGALVGGATTIGINKLLKNTNDE